ncbi:MAG: hypothetical protein LC745_06950, partial [Planctomycetia bacterium]|nr:hypothetical protein [Planctomycetia bacterium]
MAITVECGCGKRFAVRDEHAGKRIRCPTCKEVVSVPGGNVFVAKAPDPPSAAPGAGEEILSRLEGLERANRRLTVSLALSAVFLLLMSVATLAVSWPRSAATKPSRDPGLPSRLPPASATVGAEAFRLKGKDGVVRGEWRLKEDGAAVLTLNGPKGDRSVVLTATRDGECGVFLYRSDLPRATLGTVPEGPALILWDKDGSANPRARAIVSVRKDGWARFNAYGAAESHASHLSA